jgi:hypothetical protein
MGHFQPWVKTHGYQYVCPTGIGAYSKDAFCLLRRMKVKNILKYCIFHHFEIPAQGNIPSNYALIDKQLVK